MTWATRIPAAIEKGEKLTAPWVDTHQPDVESSPCVHCDARDEHNRKRGQLSKTEVALAKALWEMWPARGMSEDDIVFFLDKEVPALRAFVEKVEQLTTS